jgi:hypothetical protein
VYTVADLHFDLLSSTNTTWHQLGATLPSWCTDQTGISRR